MVEKKSNLVKKYIKNVFYLDTRSLAALRVGVATVLILDLISRLRSISDFYTDKGVFPADKFFEVAPWFNWSIHALNGGLIYELGLFFVAFVFGVMLLVGYKTRIATIACFILLLSLHNRNLVVLNSGDSILRLILFWGIFIPWNLKYSFDSILNSSVVPKRVFSIGVLGYLCQLGFLYFFASLFKTGSEWTTDYTAVYYALSSPTVATPWSHFLLIFPQVTSLLTYTVRLTEILAPILIFSPFFTSYTRLFVVIILVFMHIGFGATLLIGIFWLVDIVAILGLLPSMFWDKCFSVSKKIKSFDIKIYYDSKCGICYIFVNFLKTFFLLPQSEMIQQAGSKMSNTMDKEQSWVVEDWKGNVFFRSEALVPIFKASPLLFLFTPLLYFPGVFKIGNKVYNSISQRRHSICKIPQRKKQSGYHNKIELIGGVICLFFIIYSMFWQIGLFIPALKIPQEFRWIGPLFGVNQKWSMFAPAPLKNDGWYVISGEYEDNSEVNLLFPNKPLGYKPENIGLSYRNYHWRNFLSNLWIRADAYPYKMDYLGEYFCKTWNGEHGDIIKSVKIDFMVSKTPPPGEEKEKPYLVKWHKINCLI